ncbi:hypothetical protein EXIGLDRAFT_299111 [Exidia glandulosa HHB12029]|uniref:Uncharacterized protein n=1 Tax=Exidia glandulosa HHB12029 TaxID=1314781 RepID=A0A165M0H4_EXIGL|nr:hypothetical protein EXIGLDRAFT_299111 [Exidia glandulosa HHB12029]
MLNAHACGRPLYAFAHVAMASASLLLVIRTIAICERNRVVTIFLTGLWVVEIGTLIHGIVEIEADYIAPLFACGVVHSDESRMNIWTSFGLNLCCMTIAFVYLLRTPSAGVWRVLVSQGIIYFIVIMVGYLTPAILLSLNLNDGMNLAMQPPALVALVVCATRMYRGLVEFGAQSRTDAFVMTSTRMEWGKRPGTRDGRNITLPSSFTAASVDDEDETKAQRNALAAHENSGVVIAIEPELENV